MPSGFNSRPDEYCKNDGCGDMRACSGLNLAGKACGRELPLAARTNQQRARINEMFQHGLARFFRFTLPNRSIDPAVEHERLIERNTIRKLAHAV